MKKVYSYPLRPTVDEVARMRREEDNSYTVELWLPEKSSIKRVGTYVIQKEVFGTDPTSKEMGRMVVGEETPCMWVESPEPKEDGEIRAKERCLLRVIMFEQSIPDDAEYLGTFLMKMGTHVFHVYRSPNNSELQQ